MPVLLAAGVFVAYVAVVAALWRANRVDYPRIAESDRAVTRGIVVPIGIALVGLAAATTALGWWPDVLTQPRSGAVWMLAVPLLWLVAGLVSAVRADLHGLGLRSVAILAVACLLVGGAEELLARGMLVVGAQEAGWPLAGVWAYSTALFAVLHAINGLFGLSWKQTLAQLGVSFVGGSALFVTLMATGSLIPGILIHALWDFGALAHQARGTKIPVAAGLAVGLVYVVGLVATIVLILP